MYRRERPIHPFFTRLSDVQLAAQLSHLVEEGGSTKTNGERLQWIILCSLTTRDRVNLFIECRETAVKTAVWEFEGGTRVHESCNSFSFAGESGDWTCEFVDNSWIIREYGPVNSWIICG